MALNRNNRQKARSAFFGNNSGLETSKYSFAGIPDGAPQEDPHEQHDRTAEPGDPASHARRRQFPGRQQRVDAHLRQNQVRHRERMEHAPLPRHVPAR